MPTETPLVSVVIPTYNYGRFVTEAVDSALAQTYPAAEVIVVDDGSTDDTRERLAGYDDRIRYIYQPNAGLSAARNTGIRAARGSFVAFLDSDDVFHPRKLEIQMAMFAVRPELGLIGTEHFSDVPRIWAEVSPHPPLVAWSLDAITSQAPFSPSSAVARRECFDEAGLFDTTLRSVEDRDMWIRIAVHHQVAQISSPLTWYRITPGSMSRNPERMEQFERVVLDKAFNMPELAGRRWLRRKAMGLADLASCLVYRDTGQPWTALQRLLRSFAWWPFWYRSSEMQGMLVRPRVLAVTFCRALHGLFGRGVKTQS